MEHIYVTPSDSINGTYKTGTIRGLSARQVSARLGFAPNIVDDPDKVVNSWAGIVDGKTIAVWDYKGSHHSGRFSTFGPAGILSALFSANWESAQ